MSSVLRLDSGREIALDRDGYLRDLDDWNEEVAERLAEQAGLELHAEHWEIIHVLRRFYREHEHAPATRALVNLVARELGPDKGRSIHLMKLFRGSPALLANKLAGLPRPRNCF